MSKRLTKSSTNKAITGTIAGIAEYFNIDPTILRVIYVVIVLGGFGSPILLYILLAILIPDAPKTNNYQQKQSQRGFYSANDRKDTYYNRNQTTKRKEAEKVDDNDEDWSDF